jgi:hypothetical protein
MKTLRISRRRLLKGTGVEPRRNLGEPRKKRDSAYSHICRLGFSLRSIQKFLFPEALGVGRFVKIGIPLPKLMSPFGSRCARPKSSRS